MSEQCGNCRFFDASWGEKERGYCQRYAPRPILECNQTHDPILIWPPVESDEWCGEWQARTQPA